MLTKQQAAQYKRDGVLYPLRVLSEEEAGRFAHCSNDLEQQLGGKPRTVEVRQMHLHFEWAYALATRPAILDSVEKILGPDLLIWATEIFAKHPMDANVSINWHRDQPYMGLDPQMTTTAWVSLCQSNAHNGCMKVIPIAKDPGYPYDWAKNPRSLKPNEVPANPESAVDVTLEPGEMSLHNPMVLHGSVANLSRIKRIGFVIRFVRPDANTKTNDVEAILVRGEDRFGNFNLKPKPDFSSGVDSSPITKMQQSATQHFDTVLSNLSQQ